MEEKSYVGLANCFFCNKPKNIVLNRKLKDTLPRNAVYDKEPCDECKGHMEKGIIIISVRDGETGDNPYRTGGWWVVKDDVIKRLAKNKELLKNILEKRAMFMEDKICDMMGLKKGDKNVNLRRDKKDRASPKRGKGKPV